MKEIYVLGDCYNRNIYLTKYDNHKEAYDAMKHELDSILGFDSMDEDEVAEHGYSRGEDYNIDVWGAWCNVDDEQNDWVIEKFEI